MGVCGFGLATVARSMYGYPIVCCRLREHQGRAAYRHAATKISQSPIWEFEGKKNVSTRASFSFCSLEVKKQPNNGFGFLYTLKMSDKEPPLTPPRAVFIPGRHRRLVFSLSGGKNMCKQDLKIRSMNKVKPPSLPPPVLSLSNTVRRQKEEDDPHTHILMRSCCFFHRRQH